MHPYQYTKAKDADTAIQAVTGEENAIFLAGGTNVVDMIRRDVAHPDLLVDINNLPYKAISAHQGGLRLGALVSNSDTADNPQVMQHYPILSQAILSGATDQLRNMATNGGNLVQRTRCPYFMSPDFPCNKRNPGSGCSARNGMNRIHSIFGTSDYCIASYPSDMCAALAALDAVVQIKRADGSERSIPVTEFHRLPGDTPHIDNNLESGELITFIDLPEAAKAYAPKSVYLKVRDRHSYAFALVSVAVGLVFEDNRIQKVSMAMGSVAPKPWRAFEAEDMLTGKQPSEGLFKEAANATMASARGFGGNTFKVELGKRAIVRALNMAMDKA